MVDKVTATLPESQELTTAKKTMLGSRAMLRDGVLLSCQSRGASFQLNLVMRSL